MSCELNASAATGDLIARLAAANAHLAAVRRKAQAIALVNRLFQDEQRALVLDLDPVLTLTSDHLRAGGHALAAGLRGERVGLSASTLAAAIPLVSWVWKCTGLPVSAWTKARIFASGCARNASSNGSGSPTGPGTEVWHFFMRRKGGQAVCGGSAWQGRQDWYFRFKGRQLTPAAKVSDLLSNNPSGAWARLTGPNADNDIVLQIHLPDEDDRLCGTVTIEWK
mgnify:CR=1 FL=1